MDTKTDTRSQIKAVNKTLKEGEPNNYSTDHKGYKGYKPQAVIDAINMQFLGEWSLEVTDFSTYPTKNRKGETINNAFVKVRLTLLGQVVETFASHPMNEDPGDAFKSAETDAMKKAFAHFSIGNRAYHGLLK